MRGEARRNRTWTRPLLTLIAVLLAGGIGVARADDSPKTPTWSSHTQGLEAYGLESLVIHPKWKPDAMWAHVLGLGIASSEDGGKKWTVHQDGIDAKFVPNARTHVVLTLDPKEENTLWLVTRGQVYQSENAGKTWVNKTTQALASWSWDKTRYDYKIRGVVVDSKKSLHIFAGTRTQGEWRGGLFESTDGGKNWELIAGNDVEKSELGHDAWPIALDPRTDKNIVVGGANGLWYSDDRGHKFHRVDPGKLGWHDIRDLSEMSKSRDLYTVDGRGVWGSRDGGKRWDEGPLLAGDGVTVYDDPHSRRRLYAVMRDKGLFGSDDTRHTKWEELGHADLEIQQVLVDPRNAELVHLVSPVTGLHESSDQGATVTDVPANIGTYVPPLVSVSASSGRAGTVMALSECGRVFLSGDHAATWTRVGRTGMRPVGVQADPKAEDTWWAYGNRLLESQDNGSTWKTVYQPDDVEDRVVSLHIDGQGGIWLLLERARQIVWSEDGGKTWQDTKPPKESATSWASAFAVDEANAEHLLLATKSLTPLWTPKDEEGGPWESFDGGATWTSLRAGLFEGKNPKRNWNHGTHIALDPATGLSFYAADGLGLFARKALTPDEQKSGVVSPWVEVGPDLPNLSITAFLLHPSPDGKTTLLTLQAEGANSTRTFEEASTADVLERVASNPKVTAIWKELPDPPARLAWLSADPRVPGRLLGCDHDGMTGVLTYGVPGAETPPPPVVPPVQPAASQPAGPMPPEGLLAFTGGADGAVRVWDLSKGKLLKALPGPTAEVFAIALAPDESVLAVGGADRSIRLYDAANGEARAETVAPSEYGAVVNALCFSPDSKTLYAGLEQNWGVLAWNLATGEKRLLEHHTGGVLCVAVTRDGKHLVSGSRDQTVCCWDVAKGEVTTTLKVGFEVLAVALSPDGKRVFVGGHGPSIEVYDRETGQPVGKADVQRAYVSALAVDAVGKRLYVAGDSGVVPVDIETLNPEDTLSGPTKPVFAVAVSKDGAWILGGDSDNSLWLWAKGAKQPRWSDASAHAGAIHAVALTPDATPKAGA